MTITDGGSGYTSAPTVTFTGDGSGAVVTAVLGDTVTSVTITDRGRGYTSAPAVTFTGGGGSGAAAEARLRSGNTQSENLYWGRQALYGKQLLVEIADD